LTKDVWDSANVADMIKLKEAFLLAFQAAEQTDNGKGFIETTHFVLADKNLPLPLKAWVIGGLRSGRICAVDAQRARQEARWLVETPGLSDYDRSYGYQLLYYLEGMKGPSADPAKRFQYMAQVQTCRGATVDYMFYGLAEDRFKNGQPATALAFYLLAWSSMWEKSYPEKLRDCERKISQCLVKMENPSSAKAWDEWLKMPAAARPACPILGLGSLPPDLAAQWKALPVEGAGGQDANSEYQRGACLYNRGLQVKAGLQMVRQAMNATSENALRKAANDILQNAKKWGKQPPVRIP